VTNFDVFTTSVLVVVEVAVVAAVGAGTAVDINGITLPPIGAILDRLDVITTEHSKIIQNT
jgi:hypothetical protein